MGIQPRIDHSRSYTYKPCLRCGRALQANENFAPTRSLFFPDGLVSLCNDCIQRDIELHEWDWGFVDKLCQTIDVPFIPNEWERLKEMNSNNLFYRYCRIFAAAEYEGLHWSDYFKAFSDLRAQGKLEDELPGLSEERRQELKAKWGRNYDDEDLEYLNDLYNGLLSTQNINGKLQMDQAEKLCKISLAINRCILEGCDDKLLSQLLAGYEKLIKTGDFTPKNVKNANDFDTMGELLKWKEKGGWVNNYYDNVPRDVVDETIANMQAFNQRLYTNEAGIGEEISNRLKALQNAEKIEQSDTYATGSEIEDLDQYEADGYAALVKEEEFDAND